LAICAINVENRPYAFIRGDDGNLWSNYWWNGSWHWRDQGRPPSGSQVAFWGISAVTIENKPYVFFQGVDDAHLW
jgi:hypothetical protein